MPAQLQQPPVTPRQHRLGIAVLVLCTFLWSIAGLVTRHASVDNGWEVTFWRSLFAAACVALLLALRERRNPLRAVIAMGWPGAASGIAWAVMFTFFMLALTRTTVANTLVMSSLLPFIAAIAAWLVLGERVALRTWLAMAVALGGVLLMFADAFEAGDVSGSLLALGVPLGAAANILVLKRWGARVDLAPAVMLGGMISALVTLPAALPFSANSADLGLFALLGVFQLGLPCVIFAAFVVPRLSSAEIGLLSLLEILSGPLLAWLGVGEQPGLLALAGGAVVLAALVANEAAGLIAERRASAASATGAA